MDRREFIKCGVAAVATPAAGCLTAKEDGYEAATAAKLSELKELPTLLPNAVVKDGKLTGKNACKYVDDCIWFLRDLTRQRPKSIFVMKSSFRREGDTLTDATVELGGKKAPWIFFLHSCVWEMAMQMMSVYVDYADGSTYEIVLSGGVNIRDYATRKPDKPFIGEIDTVTRCAVTVPQVKWGKGSLFSTGWCNPQPGKPIARLRFHSLNRGVVMFAGVTLGYPTGEVKGEGEERNAVIDEKASQRFAAEAAKLQGEKKSREAIAVYEKAHAADPRQLYIMNAIGNCYDRLEDYPKAYEWYQKSLEVDHNQPHVWAYRDAAGEKAGIK